MSSVVVQEQIALGEMRCVSLQREEAEQSTNDFEGEPAEYGAASGAGVCCS